MALKRFTRDGGARRGPGGSNDSIGAVGQGSTGGDNLRRVSGEGGPSRKLSLVGRGKQHGSVSRWYNTLNYAALEAAQQW